MKFNRLILSVAFCSIAAAAHATRNPTPPPSGIVVHLFGPNSVMSKITPDLPGETSAAQPGNPSSSGHAAPGAPAASPQQADTEPSFHDVLHQLFVVGDPNHPNLPSVGRANDRPPQPGG